MHLVGKQDPPNPQAYPVASVASALAAVKSGDCRRFRGDHKRKTRSDKREKRKLPTILTCDDNALEAMFIAERCYAADSSPGESSSSASTSSSSSSDSSATDAAEVKEILAKCVRRANNKPCMMHAHACHIHLPGSINRHAITQPLWHPPPPPSLLLSVYQCCYCWQWDRTVRVYGHTLRTLVRHDREVSFLHRDVQVSAVLIPNPPNPPNVCVSRRDSTNKHLNRCRVAQTPILAPCAPIPLCIPLPPCPLGPLWY